MFLALSSVCNELGAVLELPGGLSTNFIKNNSPRGIELLEQVKVQNIAGQHRTSIFSSGSE